MVHTFEIIRSISQEDMITALSLFNFDKWKIDKFLNPNKKRSCISKKISYQLVGFKQIVFIKNLIEFAGTQYYCIIRLEPLAFIQEKRTIDIFNCTSENVSRLKTKFYQTMSNFFENRLLFLCILDNWICRRIDYTQNLQFESSEQANLFICLTKKTSQYKRTKKLVMKNHSLYHSTSEGNKSVKFILYNKHKQIVEHYNDIPQEEKNNLLCVSNGIVRLELQCKKSKVQTIGKKLNSRCILNYLDEAIANTLINQYYDKAVGYGNFYSFYHAKTIIEKASLAPKAKEKLIQILQLIAQARHVDVAKDQFMKGTKIKRTDIEVKGNSSTFSSRLEELAKLNINPMLIPKDMKIKSLLNPIQLLN